MNLTTLSSLIYSVTLFVFVTVLGASLLTTTAFSEKFNISSISNITATLPLNFFYENVKNKNSGLSATEIEGISKPPLVEGIINFGLPDFETSDGWLSSSIPGLEFYEYSEPVENSPKVEKKESTEVVPPEVAHETTDPVVHLYFTHTGEDYSNPEVDVTDVGGYIVDRLESYGIGACADDTDVGKLLKSKNEKYSQSYDESRLLVTETMAQNEDLEYFIDVHRDSAPKENTTMTYDGADYAKVSFVIGGDNKNYKQNMGLANDLSDKMNELVPGISEGVILKQGAGTNGVFNQDLSSTAILIEVGGVDNLDEELKRTSDVFAKAFSNFYWEAESVNASDGDVAK